MSLSLAGAPRRLAPRLAMLALLGCIVPSAFAATGSWLGTTDSTWANAANWSAAPAPGDGDTATFNAPSTNTTIDLGSGITVGAVVFDTAAVPIYTVGAGAAGNQTLTLSNAGSVTVNATVTAGQLFNAGLVLGTDGSTQTFTVTNSVAAGGPLLTLAGPISGSNGSGIKTLAIAGTGNTSIGGAISNDATGTVALTKAGAGTLTLSGINIYSGTTTESAGLMLVTGALGTSANRIVAFTQAASASTLTISGGALYGTTFTNNNNGTAINLTNNGTMNFTGNVTLGANNGSTNHLLSLASGTFTALGLLIGRNGNNLGTAVITSGGSTTVGAYVNGATVNLTTLTLGLSNSTNSSPNFRQDSGTTTVSGTTSINVGGNANNRISIMDINGGTFSSGAIQIGGGFATSFGELLTRNSGVVTAGTITMGGATQTSNSNYLEMVGGTVYVGGGGIVAGIGNTVTNNINIGLATATTTPTLGAAADWSSSMNITLTNNSTALAPTIKAADASNVAHNITLSGNTSGAGGLSKTGGGILTLNGTNAFAGGTTVSAGTLLVGDASHTAATLGAVAVNGGTFGGYGTVGALAINLGGTLSPGGSIGTLNAGTTTLAGNYLAEIDATSSDLLAVTGDLSLGGTLTISDLTGGAGSYAPSYTLATYTGQLSGSFASISGQPAGYTLDTSTAGQVRLVSSAPVPEPASLGILALGAAAMLTRRRK